MTKLDVGIRRYRLSDIGIFYEMVQLSEPELRHYFPWYDAYCDKRKAKHWVLSRKQAWHKHQEYSFLIYNKIDNTALGTIGINYINLAEYRAAISYWVRSDFTGKGIASSAVNLVSRYVFLSTTFQRLEIIVAIDNIASQQVALKAGATQEGLLRKRLYLHQQMSDAYLYSIVRDDIY